MTILSLKLDNTLLAADGTLNSNVLSVISGYHQKNRHEPLYITTDRTCGKSSELIKKYVTDHGIEKDLISIDSVLDRLNKLYPNLTVVVIAAVSSRLDAKDLKYVDQLREYETNLIGHIKDVKQPNIDEIIQREQACKPVLVEQEKKIEVTNTTAVQTVVAQNVGENILHLDDKNEVASAIAALKNDHIVGIVFEVNNQVKRPLDSCYQLAKRIGFMNNNTNDINDWYAYEASEYWNSVSDDINEIIKDYKSKCNPANIHLKHYTTKGLLRANALEEIFKHEGLSNVEKLSVLYSFLQMSGGSILKKQLKNVVSAENIHQILTHCEGNPLPQETRTISLKRGVVAFLKFLKSVTSSDKKYVKNMGNIKQWREAQQDCTNELNRSRVLAWHCANLHRAVKNGDKIVAALQEIPDTIFEDVINLYRELKGNTLLQAAVINGVSFDLVPQLKSRLEKYETPDTKGRTILHYAMDAVDPRVYALFSEGASKDITSLLDEDKGNILHVAAASEQGTAVTKLLGNILPEQIFTMLFQQDKNFYTPLHHVFAKNNRAAFFTLMPLIAKVEPGFKHPAFYCNKDHESILHVSLRAFAEGFSKNEISLISYYDMLCELIYRLDIKVITQPNQAGLTPVQLAKQLALPQVISQILEQPNLVKDYRNIAESIKVNLNNPLEKIKTRVKQIISTAKVIDSTKDKKKKKAHRATLNNSTLEDVTSGISIEKALKPTLSATLSSFESAVMSELHRRFEKNIIGNIQQHTHFVNEAANNVNSQAIRISNVKAFSDLDIKAMVTAVQQEGNIAKNDFEQLDFFDRFYSNQYRAIENYSAPETQDNMAHLVVTRLQDLNKYPLHSTITMLTTLLVATPALFDKPNAQNITPRQQVLGYGYDLNAISALVGIALTNFKEMYQFVERAGNRDMMQLNNMGSNLNAGEILNTEALNTNDKAITEQAQKHDKLKMAYNAVFKMTRSFIQDEKTKWKLGVLGGETIKIVTSEGKKVKKSVPDHVVPVWENLNNLDENMDLGQQKQTAAQILTMLQNVKSPASVSMDIDGVQVEVKDASRHKKLFDTRRPATQEFYDKLASHIEKLQNLDDSSNGAVDDVTVSLQAQFAKLQMVK